MVVFSRSFCCFWFLTNMHKKNYSVCKKKDTELRIGNTLVQVEENPMVQYPFTLGSSILYIS